MWAAFLKCLRESAANDNLFKLFVFHIFFVSKIYNKTFNTIIAVGLCAFCRDGPPCVKSLKFGEVCLIFIPFIDIYPEQLYIYIYILENLFFSETGRC